MLTPSPPLKKHLKILKIGGKTLDNDVSFSRMALGSESI
jgi:hypothetical protein